MPQVYPIRAYMAADPRQFPSAAGAGLGGFAEQMSRMADTLGERRTYRERAKEDKEARAYYELLKAGHPGAMRRAESELKLEPWEGQEGPMGGLSPEAARLADRYYKAATAAADPDEADYYMGKYLTLIGEKPSFRGSSAPTRTPQEAPGPMENYLEQRSRFSPKYGARQAPAAANIPAQYRAIVQQAAAENNIPLPVAANLIQTESGWNPNARNPQSGAAGLMQFMPATAREEGVDPYDPAQAIPGGLNLLARYSREEGGLPGGLKRYGGFVTKDPSGYIQKVMGDYDYDEGSPYSPQGQATAQMMKRSGRWQFRSPGDTPEDAYQKGYARKAGGAAYQTPQEQLDYQEALDKPRTEAVKTWTDDFKWRHGTAKEQYGRAFNKIHSAKKVEALISQLEAEGQADEVTPEMRMALVSPERAEELREEAARSKRMMEMNDLAKRTVTNLYHAGADLNQEIRPLAEFFASFPPVVTGEVATPADIPSYLRPHLEQSGLLDTWEREGIYNREADETGLDYGATRLRVRGR